MEDERAISRYFQLIYDHLITIEQLAPWADQVLGQLQPLKMDIRFLKMYCLCGESLDYTTEKDSMEISRSMVNSLKLIWPKEHKGLSLLERLTETWSLDIQDFCSANYELGATIQDSKQRIEGWCEHLLHSSMQCKSLTFFEIQDFLKYLHENLDDFSSYRAAKIVPLEKQIDILKSKIVFLEKSLKNIECCPYTKKIHQCLNFVRVFANKTACLVCLYWAKEDNEEIAAEMNIVLVDTLQMFMACALDVTPLYIGIIKTYDSLPSDYVLHCEAVESFVDFFFEHLAIALKEDFPVLRDRLVSLFTFLTDPPCLTAEEYLIRNQIYDLFSEDAYLCLTFDEMKDDFLDKKMLLSDCMNKTDIVNAKIKQLYSGFSDSRIRMEVEKMDYNYFVSVQRELSSIEKHAHWVDPVLVQLQLYKMELRFLRMFLLCFTTWDDTDEEIRIRLTPMIISLQGIWGKKEEKGLLAHRLEAIGTGDITNWHLFALEIEGNIRLSKLEFETWWINLLHCSLQCKPSAIYKIVKFLNLILDNLNDLVSYKFGEIVLFQKQIEALKDKVLFLRNLLRLAVNCIYSKELGEFTMFVQDFVNDAACLTLLYWVKGANDKIASETNSMLSRILQKIKPVMPDVARMYFETLKVICVQQSDSLMFGHTALSFVDLLLEDLVTILKDDFQILRDDIVFLLIFLNDAPDENVEELFYNKIDVLFWEGLYGLLPFGGMEGDFSKKNMLLSDFMMKIATVNANIRQIYCKSPDSSLFNFPKIISPRVLDFLIENLRNLEERMISDRKYVPFAKLKITKIKEELITLCPYFSHNFDCQNEQNETWSEVVNLVHLTEHVISSCISSWFVVGHPMWYHMAYLSDVFDRIGVVKTKLEEMEKNTMCNARCLSISTCCTLSEQARKNTMCNARCLSPSTCRTLSEQARPSKIDKIFVGFEDEAEKIVGKLIRGHRSLDIISIVGMGGLGKTTLAQKVYNSKLVKGNFDILAFCSVSQDHNTRRLLLDILCDIKGVENMNEDDLAHQLWKCLSRQKYLIVLDDIWNVSAWNIVKSSFPNDQNGSRVMFTTRSHEVADKCTINCSPHQLRFMSEAESWELLQKKVFHNGISPPYLCEVGKLIAQNCKGLPLAVAVIAGLLARTEKSLRWWSEVLENIVSYLSDEGCMNILELSYNHLPNNLKPCLIYLGAFPEDWVIKVKQVILLWIAEGFVQESKTKSIEDVAKEYLNDLVDRSLIIVSGRSSSGEIKTFRVHDLIHVLCQTKCRDGNFFQLRHGVASSSSSNASLYNQYRVSTQRESDITYNSGPSFSNTRSLLYFHGHGDDTERDFPLREFRLAQVLDLGFIWREYDIEQLSYLAHLRHIDAGLTLKSNSIPSSISNIWNIGSLILTSLNDYGKIHLPESFWRMKSLRHVKIDKCILKFSDGYEDHEACPKLDKVVSFSKPILSSGDDVQRLLQRLPTVKNLSCFFEKSIDHDEESVKTLDFYRKLEWLKLTNIRKSTPYLINFPSTLKKLTIVQFHLPWTAISAIADLHCLQVLKLKWISFPEPRLEMEDITFQNLKFFELNNWDLVVWNASTESLPCLEQLVIQCPELEDLPSCFGEISTLKRIVIRCSPEIVENSALRIKEEQLELGIEVEVSIYNSFS